MRYGRGKEVYNGAEGPGRQAAKKTGLVRGCRTKPFIFSGGAGGRAGAREGPRRGQPRESSCAASAGVSPGAALSSCRSVRCARRTSGICNEKITILLSNYMYYWAAQLLTLVANISRILMVPTGRARRTWALFWQKRRSLFLSIVQSNSSFPYHFFRNSDF